MTNKEELVRRDNIYIYIYSNLLISLYFSYFIEMINVQRCKVFFFRKLFSESRSTNDEFVTVLDMEKSF